MHIIKYYLILEVHKPKCSHCSIDDNTHVCVYEIKLHEIQKFTLFHPQIPLFSSCIALHQSTQK